MKYSNRIPNNRKITSFIGSRVLAWRSHNAVGERHAVCRDFTAKAVQYIFTSKNKLIFAFIIALVKTTSKTHTLLPIYTFILTHEILQENTRRQKKQHRSFTQNKKYSIALVYCFVTLYAIHIERRVMSETLKNMRVILQ